MVKPLHKLLPTLASLFLLALVFSPFKKAEALIISPVRFEVAGDPGAVLDEEMTLSNDTDRQVTYYASYSNFEANGETGSPSFVDATEGLATWISTTPSVTLAPGETKIINFTITIPKTAEPGGNFGALFWGTTPTGNTSNSVSIGAKTGVLVLLRVNGDIKEGGGILEFNTTEGKKFFTALPVPFYYRFQNSGGDRIKPEGEITIKHFLGFTRATVPANEVNGNILPQQTRRFETKWQSKNGSSDVLDEHMSFFRHVGYEWHNFAFGYYKAHLAISYGADNALVVSSVTGFWVFPWHLLFTLIVLAGILYFLWKKVSRHHREVVMSAMRKEIMQEVQKEIEDKKETGSGPSTS